MREGSSRPSGRAPVDYPPHRHVLRDLGIWTEIHGPAPRAGLVIGDGMRSGCGCLDTGVLGVLVDVVAGGAALALAEGGWIATADLALHWVAPVAAGPIEAASRVLRVGTTSIVLDVGVEQAGRSLALATLGFSRLEARSGYQRGTQLETAEHHSFANEDSGLRERFATAVGFRVVEKALGRVELPVGPYVGNSLGAVQGGVVTALASYAAECVSEFARPGSLQAQDLGVHFLALGRVGPLRSAARILREEPSASIVRVEIVDAGAEDRLCAVATVSVGPFGEAGRER